MLPLRLSTGAMIIEYHVRDTCQQQREPFITTRGGDGGGDGGGAGGLYS